ncbi:MAG: hypothetical protein O2923_14115 [Verrucomicrobia bacterium]|nr:hypothetical protein [Verrucomicrobiota bacterium]MDA1086382.1 hypothetical protein [Verrucomicrobiota bacterium]
MFPLELLTSLAACIWVYRSAVSAPSRWLVATVAAVYVGYIAFAIVAWGRGM